MLYQNLGYEIFVEVEGTVEEIKNLAKNKFSFDSYLPVPSNQSKLNVWGTEKIFIKGDENEDGTFNADKIFFEGDENKESSFNYTHNIEDSYDENKCRLYIEMEASSLPTIGLIALSKMKPESIFKISYHCRKTNTIGGFHIRNGVVEKDFSHKYQYLMEIEKICREHEEHFSNWDSTVCERLFYFLLHEMDEMSEEEYITLASKYGRPIEI